VVVACIARDFHFFVVEVNVEVCAIVKSDIARRAQPEFVFAGLYCTFFGCQFEVVGGAGVFGDSMLTADPFRKQLTSFFFFFFRRNFVIRQQLGCFFEKLLFLLLSVHVVGFAVFYSFKGKHFNFMGMGHLHVYKKSGFIATATTKLCFLRCVDVWSAYSAAAAASSFHAFCSSLNQRPLSCLVHLVWNVSLHTMVCVEDVGNPQLLQNGSQGIMSFGASAVTKHFTPK
jgi:hypothetical protein